MAIKYRSKKFEDNHFNNNFAFWMWWQYLELDAGAASALSENGNRVWIASEISNVIFNPPED
jgi:hypothetical protein